MDHTMMFRFLLLIFVVLSILVQPSSSINRQFKACVRKRCGNGPIISFPFWIAYQHESYCGHPKFEITCTDDKSILSISNEEYLVRNIFYNNQSFLASNMAELNDGCSTPRRNISSIHEPFKFSSNNLNLSFLYNCASLPTNYPYHQISCGTNTPTRPSFVAFFHNELKYLNASKEKCELMVNAPVDMAKEMSIDTLLKEGYIETLKKGFALEWTANDCSGCEGSGGRCGLENNEFVCFCRDQPRSQVCSKETSRLTDPTVVLIVGILAAGSPIAVTMVVIFCCLRSKSSTSTILWKVKAKNAKHVEAFLKDCGLLAPKRYNYTDIKKITTSFKDKIGQGGFGSVFKGNLPDGRMVAVKLLSETKGNGNEFINEVASISRTSHVNIVSLLGFCIDGPKRALIYEFMPNGSLEKFIYSGTLMETHHHLGWETLHKVAIGIARGLEYLHRGCNTRILHFDIKPHNILLDQDYSPKIADFGLSKICHVKESMVTMTGARGTAGYIAPEVVSRNFGVVSHKSDVYSYGMMVLEMVGGRKNIDVRVTNMSEIYFPHWIYKRLNLNENLGLHGVRSLDDQEIAQKMILAGLWCIQIDPQDRPPMSRVLEMLEGSLEALQMPPKPFPSSPSREE